MMVRLIILGVLFGSDMLATYFYVGKIRKKYPKIDYKRFEYNLIVRWCWEKFGFHKGMMVAPVLMSPFWIAYAVMSVWRDEFFYIILGMYMVVFLVHYDNLITLATKQKTVISELYDKAYGGE
jgi:hypothetical protein